jgi:hypothetical protein
MAPLLLLLSASCFLGTSLHGDFTDVHHSGIPLPIDITVRDLHKGKYIVDPKKCSVNLLVKTIQLSFPFLSKTCREELLFDNNVITIRQDDTRYERLLRRCFTKIPEKQLQLTS